MSNVTFVAHALRYYPNLVTGEFLNVGVLLVCRERDWWGARFATDMRTITGVYPTAQPRALASLLNRIEKRLHAATEDGSLSLELNEPWKTVLDPIQRTLGQLSGTLRWSERPIEGITGDPSAELEYWFGVLVQV